MINSIQFYRQLGKMIQGDMKKIKIDLKLMNQRLVPLEEPLTREMIMRTKKEHQRILADALKSKTMTNTQKVKLSKLEE